MDQEVKLIHILHETGPQVRIKANYGDRVEEKFQNYPHPEFSLWTEVNWSFPLHCWHTNYNTLNENKAFNLETNWSLDF